MEYVNPYLCQLKASSSTSLYGHIYTSVYVRYGFVATTKTTLQLGGLTNLVKIAKLTICHYIKPFIMQACVFLH